MPTNVLLLHARVRLKDPVARKERQKERNRTHAKVSRLRKKFFINTLEVNAFRISFFVCLSFTLLAHSFL
jgi:hypothetical protein